MQKHVMSPCYPPNTIIMIIMIVSTIIIIIIIMMVFTITKESMATIRVRYDGTGIEAGYDDDCTIEYGQPKNMARFR